MEIVDFIATGFGATLALFAGHLLRPYVERWISHRFDQAMEERQFQNRLRENAVKIAEYLAFLRRHPTFDADEAEKANRILFEMALVLPSETFAALAGYARDPKRDSSVPLMAVRELLRPNDPLDPNNYLVHETPENLDKLFELMNASPKTPDAMPRFPRQTR